MKKSCFVASPVIISCLFPALTAAASASATMDLNLTVVSACEVATTGLAFEIYQGAETESKSEITVTCNHGAPFRVGLDAGLNADGIQRMLSDGNGNALPYRLVNDDGDGEWGDEGIGDTYPAPAVSGLGDGAPARFVVEGEVLADQLAPSGDYSDTVTVIVSF